MVRQGFTQNTIKAFLGDLRLLSRYTGLVRPVQEIGTQTLWGFLTYLKYHRGVPCTPKSYARRVTTLKVFFKWLAQEGVIPSDPAAALIHEPASSPLPQILYDAQVERLLEVTKGRMEGDKADARPYLLVTLLLHTGLKSAGLSGWDTLRQTARETGALQGHLAGEGEADKDAGRAATLATL